MEPPSSRGKREGREPQHQNMKTDLPINDAGDRGQAEQSFAQISIDAPSWAMKLVKA